MKVTAILAAIIAMLSLLLWAHHERAERRTLEGKYTTQAALLASTQDTLKTEREQKEEAEGRAKNYQADRNRSQAELQRLRDCLADGTCGVRVHYAPRETVSCTDSGPPGTPGADAGHTGRLEQDYLRLLDTIALVADRYAALQRELVARSKPDYCGAK